LLEAEEGVASPEDDVPLAVELSLRRTAAATSVGNEMAVLLRGDKSTLPSLEIVSGFMAKKDLEYMTFSATYGADQDGILLMSMPFPQAAAAGWPAVTLDIYDQAAWVSGVELATVGSIISTEPGAPGALGGLMIPNMPF